MHPGDEHRTSPRPAPSPRPPATGPTAGRGRRGPCAVQALPQGTRRLVGRGELRGRARRGVRVPRSNGAGKSTTIGILTTRIRPTGGRAVVAGVDVAADPVAARRVLGVVPQQNNLDRSLSVRQNLLFHASYHGVPRARRTELADALLDQFGLADRPDGRPDDFSGGQIQRMMIARALDARPVGALPPTSPPPGWTPPPAFPVGEGRRTEGRRGTTVVITTHDMDEAATLSDRVAIIDHGTLLALDTPTAAGAGHAQRTDARLHRGAGSAPATPARSGPPSAGWSGRVGPARRPGRERLAVPDRRRGEAAPFVAPVATPGRRGRSPAHRRPASASPTSRTSSSI